MQTMIDAFAVLWLLAIIVFPLLVGAVAVEWWLDHNDPFRFPRE